MIVVAEFYFLFSFASFFLTFHFIFEFSGRLNKKNDYNNNILPLKCFPSDNDEMREYRFSRGKKMFFLFLFLLFWALHIWRTLSENRNGIMWKQSKQWKFFTFVDKCQETRPVRILNFVRSDKNQEKRNSFCTVAFSHLSHVWIEWIKQNNNGIVDV